MIRILDGLYLGNRESARDLRRLRDIGITHIVNCTSELPNYHEGHFVYLTMKMHDPDPGFHERIPGVCKFIDEGRKKGRVLVHCFAAMSRSPSVVLAYLCHLGDPLDKAAERLGGIVWTDPDSMFLEQLARHHSLAWDEYVMQKVALTLQGRIEDDLDD